MQTSTEAGRCLNNEQSSCDFRKKELKARARSPTNDDVDQILLMQHKITLHAEACKASMRDLTHTLHLSSCSTPI